MNQIILSMSTQEIVFIPTEYLDFPILNDFMTLKELKIILMINKHFNEVSKKQIKKQINKMLDFSEKLEKIIILKNNSYLYSYELTYNIETHSVNNYTSDNFKEIQREILPYVNENKKNQYNPLYWYNLFGKTLNPQELALYYLYFVLNYYTPEAKTKITRGILESKWNCVLYEDGFIKSLPSIDNSYSISNDNQTEYYLIFKKMSHFENDYYGIEFYMNHMNLLIDTTLLKNLYVYIKKNSSFDEGMRKMIYPSIKEAIINIYQI